MSGIGQTGRWLEGASPPPNPQVPWQWPHPGDLQGTGRGSWGCRSLTLGGGGGHCCLSSQGRWSPSLPFAFQPERGQFLHFHSLTFWVGNAKQVSLPKRSQWRTCRSSRGRCAHGCSPKDGGVWWGFSGGCWAIGRRGGGGAIPGRGTFQGSLHPISSAALLCREGEMRRSAPAVGKGSLRSERSLDSDVTERSAACSGAWLCLPAGRPTGGGWEALGQATRGAAAPAPAKRACP